MNKINKIILKTITIYLICSCSLFPERTTKINVVPKKNNKIEELIRNEELEIKLNTLLNNINIQVIGVSRLTEQEFKTKLKGLTKKQSENFINNNKRLLVAFLLEDFYKLLEVLKKNLNIDIENLLKLKR